MDLFIPNGERVLVEKKKFEEKKVNGIIMPTKEENQASVVATIVCMGNCFNEDSKKQLKMKEGSVVRIKNYGHEEIDIEDKKYMVVNLDAIIGVYKEGHEPQ